MGDCLGDSGEVVHPFLLHLSIPISYQFHFGNGKTYLLILLDRIRLGGFSFFGDFFSGDGLGGSVLG